ncbi:MAG: HPr family phosphocarrier protein [Planctomycetota bacterium]
MPQASVDATIINRLGLHARPAMSVVDVAATFSSDVKISNGKQSVDAKSIMQIMMLAATQGTALTIEADGPDADAAVAAIKELIDSKFGDPD